MVFFFFCIGPLLPRKVEATCIPIPCKNDADCVKAQKPPPARRCVCSKISPDTGFCNCCHLSASANDAVRKTVLPKTRAWSFRRVKSSTTREIRFSTISVTLDRKLRKSWIQISPVTLFLSFYSPFPLFRFRLMYSICTLKKRALRLLLTTVK